MTITVGDRLPQATFTQVTPDGPQPIGTDAFFAGKRIALFSVPGAFTPTCSVKHLPSFIARAADLKAAGVDAVACTAVNDAFVLGAWAEQNEVGEAITMLADGNGVFAKAIGLEMDGQAYGMGMRSQRYSMVINDGEVEQLNIEGPGEYRVSSAEYMLERL